MVIYKSECHDADVELDVNQLGAWPLRWICKVCRKPAEIRRLGPAEGSLMGVRVWINSLRGPNEQTI